MSAEECVGYIEKLIMARNYDTSGISARKDADLSLKIN